MKQLITTLSLSAVILTATGCFRVSSETRALRNAALDNGISGAEEKFELSLGRLTFAAANFGLSFVKTDDIPPEARQVLSSVKGAEVSLYHFKKNVGDLAEVLKAADHAMEEKRFDRLVGVIEGKKLIAVYVPKNLRSARNVNFNILVLDRHDLVCVGARGDLNTIMDLAMTKAQEHLPRATASAAEEKS